MLDSRSAPVARQMVVGLACAALVAVAEALVAALGDHAQRVTPGEFATAMADLFAFYAPLALAVGLASTPLVVLLGRVRALRPWALFSWASVFRPQPALFARLVAGLVAIGAFVGGATYSSHEFATRFHLPWLAALANALAMLGLLLAVGLLFAAVRVVLEALARGALGPLASVGVVGVVAAGAAVGAVYAFWLHFPDFFVTYPPLKVAWGPAIALVFTVGSVLASRVERRAPRRARAFRVAAMAAALTGLACAIFVGATYGHDNRVRHVVEDRTVGGGAVVRAYINLTDRDRDGFSFAFGGGDCDDSDPAVYPGAPDVEGDGVDADCFAGDGSPEVAALGDGHPGEVPDEVPRRPNILFLSVDALRPDHLGVNGYERPTSPNIDAFARTAVRFENTYAQSTRSIRSMSSMMTGLYPSEIRYGEEIEWTSVDPSNVTLAERLREQRYGTAASMGSSYFERAHGFFQGFGEVVHNAERVRAAAPQQGLRMLNQLQQQDNPWMVWIHLMNVHQPYLPEGTESRFGPTYWDKYDDEIILADEQVGHVLDRLEELGLDDDTVVVLFSDHGEAMGEHGVYGHTTTLFEEELRATLMIRAPGIAPRVVTDRVGLIDVYATVLNLARLPIQRQVASHSLVPLMTGEAETLGERELIAEILPDGRFPYDRKVLLRGRYKLHWWVREGRFALFDLEDDPGEREDLSSERPELADELLGLLRAWTSSRSRPEQQWRHAVESDVLRYPPDRIENPVNLTFQGAFTLLGCDVDERRLRPGGTLTVQCFWRVDESTTRDYQMLVEAAVPPSHPALPHMRSEHYPVGGRYMTSQWEPGEIVRDRVSLTMPDELQRGTTVRVLLRVRDGRTVLPFSNGTSVLTIDTVRVPGTAPTTPTTLTPALPPDAGPDAPPAP